MKWEDASKIIREGWEEELEIDDGSYYKEHVKKVLDKKDLFLKSAEQFGTPQYILDEGVLKKKALGFMNTFRKYIPNSGFFYAFKSNDLPYLVRFLKNLGYNADVAGLFELKLALKLGFDKIIFTGPGKSVEELNLAIENKDRVIINIDNMDELDRVIGLVKEGKVGVSIRVNPDSAVMKNWSKFGVDFNDLRKAISKANSSEKLDLIGLHFHSSWNDTPERYCKNIKPLI